MGDEPLGGGGGLFVLLEGSLRHFDVWCVVSWVGGRVLPAARMSLQVDWGKNPYRIVGLSGSRGEQRVRFIVGLCLCGC